MKEWLKNFIEVDFIFTLLAIHRTEDQRTQIKQFSIFVFGFRVLFISDGYCL